MKLERCTKQETGRFVGLQPSLRIAGLCFYNSIDDEPVIQMTDSEREFAKEKNPQGGTIISARTGLNSIRFENEQQRNLFIEQLKDRGFTQQGGPPS